MKTERFKHNYKLLFILISICAILVGCSKNNNDDTITFSYQDDIFEAQFRNQGTIPA